MQWHRKGDYALISGEYKIAKFMDDGDTTYLLSHGDKTIKYCSDADEAKELAEDHRKAA
jgi:hypothetical protein